MSKFAYFQVHKKNLKSLHEKNNKVCTDRQRTKNKSNATSTL